MDKNSDKKTDNNVDTFTAEELNAVVNLCASHQVSGSVDEVTATVVFLKQLSAKCQRLLQTLPDDVDLQ